jgi:hypothetical protein
MVTISYIILIRPVNLAMTQPITDYIATALSIVLFIVAYKKYFVAKDDTSVAD